MTTYEFLKLNKSCFEVSTANGIDVKSVKNIEVFEEWQRLKSEGHKSYYIAQYLAERFGISSGHVFKLVKKMNREIKL